MYSFEFSPTYVSNPLSNYFEYSSEVVYNGKEQAPTLKSGVGVLEEEISYQYKLENDDEFIDGKPITVGTYDIKITINSAEISGTCQVKFTILKKKIKFKESTITYSYGDLNASNQEICSTWEILGAELESRIKFVDEQNVEATELSNYQFNSIGMNNGVYQYGDCDLSLDTTTYIAGSTYIVEVSLHNSIAKNYEFINGNSFLLKYRTVYVNGALYTIDEAAAMNKDITLVGSDNRYVESCFSLILSTKSYDFNGVTIKVPYSNSSKNYECIYQNNANSIYSTLMIPAGITLNLYSQSNFNVGAIIDASGFVEQRGVVMNHGIINLYNSNYRSYGFTKGNGLITCDKDSYVLDVFSIYDWPGADEAIDLKDAKAFPVLKWSVHNISCTLRIYKDGVFDSMSYIVVVSGAGKLEVKNIYIIGEEGTSKCLFKPSSSAVSTDYVEKRAVISNDSYTVSNQVYGQKDEIKLYGDYIDSNVQVVAKYLIFNYSFETSTDMAIPLTNFDLYIMEGNLTLSNTSYILYDKTSVAYVDSNATLTINGDAYLVSRPGSYLHLNGKLTGNGFFAGNIITDVTDAIIEISNYNVTGSILKTSSTTWSSTDYAATGIISENGNISESPVNFTSPNLYISKESNGIYYFEGSSKYNTYTIIYVLNGDFNNGLPTSEEEKITKVIPSFEDTYFVDSNMLLDSDKLYYYVDNWYVNNNFDESSLFNGVELTSTSNIVTVYAKWSEKQFSFLYFTDYEDSEGIKTPLTEGVDYSNINSTFTISSFIDGYLNITTIASYSKDGKDLDFTGWYLGYDESYKINNQLSKNIFEAYVEESDLNVVYLYGKFTENILYSVELNFNLSGVTVQSQELYSNQKINLYENITKEYDENPNERYYLYGWYYIQNPTTSSTEKYVSSMEISEILEKITISDDNVIELHAYWVEKNYVDYYDMNNDVIEGYRQWFKPGKYITLINEENLFEDSRFSSDKDYSEGKVYHARYTFNKLSNIDDADMSISPGQSFTSNNKVTNLKILYDVYEYCIINITVSNATVTVDGDSFSTAGLKEVARNKNITISVTYDGDSEKSFKIDGSTIDGTSTSKAFEYDTDIDASSTSSCIVSGTMITLADGSIKPIEEVTFDDYILVFNHETGKYDVSKMLFITHKDEDYGIYEVIELFFNDGSNLRIVQEHVLFDSTLNEYVTINKANVVEFIGHDFYSTECIDGKLIEKKITLKSFDIYNDNVKLFCPVTAFHMNCFANGVLIMPSMPYDITGLFNIFELDENMQYNKEQKEKDIEKYGIFNYEEFNEFIGYEISYEAYLASPAIYLKVSLGKELTTREKIIKCIEYLLFRNLIT